MEGDQNASLELIKTRTCPECNMLLSSEYTDTKVTCCCSLMLCVGLACWVPLVLDSCQKVELRCEQCEKTVA